MVLLCFFLMLQEYPDPALPELQAHVRFLADDLLEGRRTSFRGQHLAARYIAAHFARLGLKPLGHHPENPYFLPYQVQVGTVDKAQTRIRLKGKGKTYEALMGSGFYVSADRPERHGPDPVVFVGYGLHDDASGYDDLAGLNVEGAWAVLLSGFPAWAKEKGIKQPLTYQKARWLRRNGAKGVIMLYPPEEGRLDTSDWAPPTEIWLDEDPPAGHSVYVVLDSHAIPQFFGRYYKKYVSALAALKQGIPAGFALKDRMLDLQVGFLQESKPTENVAAYIPGSHPRLRDEMVVISAHYDHVGVEDDQVYNGADDNASGTAVLLRLAHDLAGQGLKRSLVLVAVSGEEEGLLGSQYFVNHPPMALESVVAGINIDMVGRCHPEEVGLIPAQTASVSSLFKIVEGLIDSGRYGLHLRIDQDRYNTRSDHYNFLKKNIPAIFFFGGEHVDYHAPDDDWDRIDYEKMGKVYRLVHDTVVQVANDPEKPYFLNENQGEGASGGEAAGSSSGLQ